MQVIFVRHGESRSNAARDVVALPVAEGDRLTERGRGQAEAAARHLARLTAPDLILSSPLQRARETAAALRGSLGAAIRFEIEPSIRELSESSEYTSLDIGRQLEQRWARRMAERRRS